ncbi:MAG: hypothetical protein ABSA46_17275 [Thermodesulfovibrionales bacterium]|jgi:hypothetical protein
MAHSFTVKVSDEIPSIIKKVESRVIKDGGSFEGNTERGSFGGKSFLGLIKGEYACISNQEIRITITHKPFIVPYSLIELEVRKYLG